MRLSDQTKSKLYEAISEPVMQRRVEIRMSTDVFDKRTQEILDERLFRMEQEIWKQVKKALNLSDT